VFFLYEVLNFWFVQKPQSIIQPQQIETPQQIEPISQDLNPKLQPTIGEIKKTLDSDSTTTKDRGIFTEEGHLKRRMYPWN
jgi:hypothetical protein